MLVDQVQPTRRQLLRAAAASTGAVVLAGCGSDSGAASMNDPFGITADRPLEVVIFNGGFGEDYAKAHEATYSKAYPRSKVTHTATKKIHTDLADRFAGGTPPDVVNNDGADEFTIGELVNDGQLCDLNEFLDSPSLQDPNVKIRDTLMPGTVDAGTFNGNVYALNYAYTVFGLFHDAAVWDRNGWQPPTTWDEFTALAPKIKAAGMAPWAHAGKYPYYMGWPLGDWIQKTGGVAAAVAIDNLEAGAWKQDAVRAAVGMLIEMVSKGYVLPGSERLSHTESQQALIDGKVAMLPCGTWIEGEMKATLPDTVKLSIAPVWSVTAGDKLPFGTVRAGASGAFVVPARAANKAGGLQYLRIMASKAGAAKFSELTHSLASVAGSADGVTGSSTLESAAKAVKAAGGNITAWKFNDWYAELDKAWQASINAVMTGATTTPDTFCTTMQAAADRVAGDSSITRFKREQ